MICARTENKSAFARDRFVFDGERGACIRTTTRLDLNWTEKFQTRGGITRKGQQEPKQKAPKTPLE